MKPRWVRLKTAFQRAVRQRRKVSEARGKALPLYVEDDDELDPTLDEEEELPVELLLPAGGMRDFAGVAARLVAEADEFGGGGGVAGGGAVEEADAQERGGGSNFISLPPLITRPAKTHFRLQTATGIVTSALFLGSGRLECWVSAISSATSLVSSR